MTELEWKCCPGYSGENCYDGPTSHPDIAMPPFKGAALPHRPSVKGFPHGPRPPIEHKPGGGQLEPGKPFPGIPTGKTNGEKRFHLFIVKSWSIKLTTVINSAMFLNVCALFCN